MSNAESVIRSAADFGRAAAVGPVCDRFVLEKFGFRFRVSCSKPSAIIPLHIFLIPFEPLLESGAKPGVHPTRPSNLGPSPLRTTASAIGGGK
jgi:hypothetical protein